MLKKKHFLFGAILSIGLIILSIGCIRDSMHVLDVGNYWNSATQRCEGVPPGCIHGYMASADGTREEFVKVQ